MKITLYEDPGHAWAKVPKKKLEKLGILDQISGCSFQRGKYLYLEEDCDLPLFIRAMKAQGQTVEIESRFTNRSSRIRGYENWAPKE